MLNDSGSVPFLFVKRMNQQASFLRDESLNHLATGNKINRAADRPSSLITAEHLNAALARLTAENQMLQRADQTAQVADGALSEISGLLVEAEALAVASANTGALSADEVAANQMQLDSILQSIDRIGVSTTFADVPLLDGSFTLQAGDRAVALDAVSTSQLGQVTVDGLEYRLSDLGSVGSANLVDGDIGAAQQAIRTAMDQINTTRGQVGGFATGVRAELNANMIAIENLTAAVSAIRDTDFAEETSRLVRYQLLSRTSGTLMRFVNHDLKSTTDLLA